MKTAEFVEKTADKEALKSFTDNFVKNKKSLFKLLLGIYKGNYFTLLKAAFFYAIQHSPVVILPICTANIINCAADPANHSINEIIINIAFLLIMFLQNILTCHFSAKNRSRANRSVEYRLRSAMARKLQQLSITFHKEMSSGFIQSKVMRDVENIQSLCNNIFTSGIGMLLNFTVAVSVTLRKSPIVLLFFVVIIPIDIAIVRLFRNKMRSTNREFRKEVEKTSERVIEMEELIPITKAHALEHTALDRFNLQLTKMAGTGYSLDVLNALFGAVNWVTVYIFQIICLGFTSFLAFKGTIPIGDITLYQSYFSQLVGCVSTLINLIPLITSGLESVRSVGDIMWAMDIEDNKGKKNIKELHGEYEFKNVFFHYADDPAPVLKGVSFKVNPGETVAFVGESGSGKSTILNMIIGFYRPTDGAVLIDGQNVDDINLQSYRALISTVPQTSVLFSGSIKDNITFGLPSCTDEQLWNAIDVANLRDVINKLPNGIDTNVGEHGDKLSGGQRQRIAIARAVIRDSRVIIFDEATSALDTVSEKLIQDSLDKLSVNRTTFIVAHRLSTIRNADKVAVIENGVCVEFGTFQELMDKKGAFYKYKMLQS